MKNLLRCVALSIVLAVSLVPPARAWTPPTYSPPVYVTESTTNLLFYFWGYMDGQATADSLAPGDHQMSFRDMAIINRTLAAVLSYHSNAHHVAAYVLGRADAFAAAAEEVGE